jgi:hypothetical protein
MPVKSTSNDFLLRVVTSIYLIKSLVLKSNPLVLVYLMTV